jgi:hypothetical protein
LTEPQADGFIAWLEQEGAGRHDLTQASLALLVSVLQEDFGRRARRFYLGRPDVRVRYPDGLAPRGAADLYRWFIRHGCAEGRLSPDEALWLAIQASEATHEEEEELGEAVRA